MSPNLKAVARAFSRSEKFAEFVSDAKPILLLDTINDHGFSLEVLEESMNTSEKFQNEYYHVAKAIQKGIEASKGLGVADSVKEGVTASLSSMSKSAERLFLIVCSFENPIRSFNEHLDAFEKESSSLQAFIKEVNKLEKSLSPTDNEMTMR